MSPAVFGGELECAGGPLGAFLWSKIMKLQPIAIFGAGGFGLEVAMLIDQINAVTPTWEIVGFFDDNKGKGAEVMGHLVLGGLADLNVWNRPLALAFAMGNPKARTGVAAKISNPAIWFPTLIHPSVIMGDSRYVKIGEGAIICAGTIITTHIEIGRFVLLNLACTVGHETVIGDHSSFMPTCNISGACRIGERTYWGTGAKVINGVLVGDEVTVGSGAVVIRDVPAGVTVVGVPAKAIKEKP